MSTNKKIAVFGIKTYPAFAGADRVAESIINHSSDNIIYYVYLVKAVNQIQSTDKLKFIYIPALKGKHLKAFSFFLFCTLHLLFKNTVDIIHAHNSDTGLFTFLLSLKYKKRIVGTFHGNPYERDKWGWLAKQYLRISESLFLQSCTYLTSVTSSKIVKHKEIYHIPNGIDILKNINEDTLLNSLGFTGDDFILFACGRLDRTKGLHLLLEAYCNMRFEIPLLIIGDFNHDYKYSNYIDHQISLIKDKRVTTIKSLLPKEQLLYIIRQSKLVVFPSQVEAMSMFLLEALSCDKVVVCSDIKENVDVVGRDYKFLFRNNNVNSLESVLQFSLEKLSQYSDYISNVTDSLIQRFNWSDITVQYENIFNKIS